MTVLSSKKLIEDLMKLMLINFLDQGLQRSWMNQVLFLAEKMIKKDCDDGLAIIDVCFYNSNAINRIWILDLRFEHEKSRERRSQDI